MRAERRPCFAGHGRRHPHLQQPTPKATVFPGENNSPATNLVLTEPSAGFLPAGSSITYTIATAGVVFSTAPSVTDNNAGMTLPAFAVLSADRKSATSP